MFADSLKKNTTRLQVIHRNQLTKGRYTCPRINVGCKILILGQKLSDTASLKSVYDPLIRAWLAIMAAAVEINIPGRRNHLGIIVKNGFRSAAEASFIINHAPCPK